MSIKESALWLVDATVGSSKEITLGGIAATAGTALSAYFGGWDTPLRLLVGLMIADYVTGLLGAIRSHSVNSEVMFWGGIRKGIVLMVVILAVMLDQFVGNSAPVFRTLAIYFYAGREGLSVVENLGILGVPLPSGVTQFLQQLQEKGDGKQ